MSSLPLAGQVAVITGASRGVAVHLARRGALAAGVASPSEDLESMRLAAADGEIVPLFAGVTPAEQVHGASDAVHARFGPPALVVTFAGTASVLGPAWAADPDTWWQAVKADLRALPLAIRSQRRRWLRCRPAGLPAWHWPDGSGGEAICVWPIAWVALGPGAAQPDDPLAGARHGVRCPVPFRRRPGDARDLLITNAGR
jgi:NAD(P)-dependent dehydrogenase (short-subunit alcohol dehydrogenase family)